MDIKVLVDTFATLGIGGFLVVIMALAAWKIAPAAIAAYKEAKKTEQEAFAERQKAYEAQSAKMIETAAQYGAIAEKNSSVIQQNTKAFETLTAKMEADTKAMVDLNARFIDHDKRAEKMNIDIGKILENVRN